MGAQWTHTSRDLMVASLSTNCCCSLAVSLLHQALPVLTRSSEPPRLRRMPCRDKADSGQACWVQAAQQMALAWVHAPLPAVMAGLLRTVHAPDDLRLGRHPDAQLPAHCMAAGRRALPGTRDACLRCPVLGSLAAPESWHTRALRWSPCPRLCPLRHMQHLTRLQ